MSQYGVLPPPRNITQLIDWRFTQIQQGLFLHTNSIKTSIDETFGTLNDRISHFFEEIHTLKKCVMYNKEVIQELPENER